MASSLTPYCPRCGGRMCPGRDLYGEYSSCLNCGYYADVYVGPPVELKAAWHGPAPAPQQTKKGKVKQ